ncbi:MAG: hypothetical protein QM724_00715 [Flavobacteriales bacterium]
MAEQPQWQQLEQHRRGHQCHLYQRSAEQHRVVPVRGDLRRGPASTPVQITVSEPAMDYYTYTGAQINAAFGNWSNRCSTGDVPLGMTAGYWRNTPAYGPGSWRASNADKVAAGWTYPFGGDWYTTAGDGTPNAVAVSEPTARFHAYDGNSVTGTLDFYVNMSAATGAEKLRFEFTNQYSDGILSVWISTNGGTSFTQLGTTTPAYTTGSYWVTQEFTIGSTSATTVIRLKGTAPSYNGNDIGVDNFRIIPAATCTAPTAPAASVTGPGTVDVGWTCASCTGNFYVEYGVESFTPGTGASAGGGTVAGPFTSNPATLSGLPTGSYTAYVRQNCGGGGFSDNAGPVTFGIAAGDFCANAINMATLPLTNWSEIASTANALNNYSNSACFSGMTFADVVLYRDVEVGATISFVLQGTGAKTTVAYGGSCPGTTSLACGTGYLSTGTYVQTIASIPSSPGPIPAATRNACTSCSVPHRPLLLRSMSTITATRRRWAPSVQQ